MLPQRGKKSGGMLFFYYLFFSQNPKMCIILTKNFRATRRRHAKLRGGATVTFFGQIKILEKSKIS